MKQAFAGAVLAAVVFTAAGFAYSTTRPNAVTPGQFNALKKRVAKLEKDDQAVSSYIGTCLFHWQGITQYGNPAAQQGFLYTPDGSTLYVRTGLDFPVQGQAPTLSIPATTNSMSTQMAWPVQIFWPPASSLCSPFKARRSLRPRTLAV